MRDLAVNGTQYRYWRLSVRVLAALSLALAVSVGGLAFAQGGESSEAANVATADVLGTQIILPDGTRCLPLPPAERGDVAGTVLQLYCGDGMPKGLVGGVLESAGQISLEVVDLSGGDGTDLAGAATRLALFDVQQLVLVNDAVCRPAEQATIAGTSKTVTYECELGGSRWVILGAVESRTVDGFLTEHVYLAEVGADGAVAGAEQNVDVAVIDGSLPLTKGDWVMTSWGTGQAPPIEGAAPTITFNEGMISGRTGCNSFFAPASILAPGQLELGVVGATLMMCEESLMRQEQRFMAALDGVSGYELIDGDLFLFGGAEVVRFGRVEQQ
ncbi:MAG: META domain-containing protein [Trueperaceae bacterium]